MDDWRCGDVLKSNPKLTKEQAIRAHGNYLCGVSVRRLAAEYKCTKSSIYRAFERNNLKTRTEVMGKKRNCFSGRAYKGDNE